MIIKRVSTTTRTHSLRGRGYGVDIRPASLWRLPICALHKTSEIERKNGLALRDVCGEVEFRDKKANHFAEIIQVV